MGWDSSKRHGPAGRFGMIENIDENFGRMMQHLKDWNALDNTLIIFMTDNGMNYVEGKKNGKKTPYFTAGLRGHKGTPYEGGTRVPSFWYWPGVLKEGVDVNGLTAHIDMYQTFADLVSAKLPAEMQSLDGRSLLPLLQDPDVEWPDRELFVHVGRWEEKHPQAKNVASAKFVNCAVRSERWRLVRQCGQIPEPSSFMIYSEEIAPKGRILEEARPIFRLTSFQLSLWRKLHVVHCA